MSKEKPNLLFLMSDQHTASLMGCMGAGFVRTPNMDRLAKRGVLFTNTYCAHPHLEQWWKVWGFDRLTPEQVRAGRRCYLGMISMVDTWIGQVLDALEASGLADNTIIVYTSDHGEMWGEHGLWGKQVFYEESARIPFILAGPNQGIPAGRVVDTPVSQLDMYPTFRDITKHDQWDIPLNGRSLWPALSRGEALADEPVFCEYYGPNIAGPDRMLRLGKWKLNYYHHHPLELFDLEADPKELNNLADRPEFAAKIDELYKLLTKDRDPNEQDRKARADQNRRTLVKECYPGSRSGL